MLAPHIIALSLILPVPHASSIHREAVQDQGTGTAKAPARPDAQALAEGALVELARALVDGHWAENGELSAEEVTATALLAFLGDGQTTSRGAQASAVKAGAKWLLKSVDGQSGQIGAPGAEGDRCQVLALNVVADLVVLENSALLKTRLRKLVAGTIGRQHGDGLWGQGGDRVTTTAWALVGLGSAIHAGVSVSEERVALATAALDRLTDPKTGAVSPFDGAPEAVCLEATAAAAVGKLMVGRLPGSDEALARSLSHLSDALKPGSFPKVDDLGFWHWTTLARVQMGESAPWWRTAVEKTRPVIGKLNDDTGAVPIAHSVWVISAAYRLRPMLPTKK